MLVQAGENILYSKTDLARALHLAKLRYYCH
jgi:hypothetical protein